MFCPNLVASFCIMACIKILLANISVFKMSAEEEAEDLRRGICANSTIYAIYSSY